MANPSRADVFIASGSLSVLASPFTLPSVSNRFICTCVAGVSSADRTRRKWIGALYVGTKYCSSAWTKKRNHPVMHRLGEFIRLTREHSERSFPLVGLRIHPEVPNASHPKGSCPETTNSYLCFFALVHFLLFKDRIGRNDAAPSLE